MRSKGTRRDIDVVMREPPAHGLCHADEDHVCADGHKWDVQVWCVGVLPWRLISVAACDLQARRQVCCEFCFIATDEEHLQTATQRIPAPVSWRTSTV